MARAPLRPGGEGADQPSRDHLGPESSRLATGSPRPSVRAVVAPTAPPPGFDRVEKFGSVWVAWLDARPMVEVKGGRDS